MVASFVAGDMGPASAVGWVGGGGRAGPIPKNL